MSKPDYVPEAKNSRAVCQMKAWLTAVGIPHRSSTNPESDITVTNSDGGETEVKVIISDKDPVSPSVIPVLFYELTSNDLAVAFASFHKVTEAAGYGSPKPVDRGISPDKKLHYSDNFELVSMRHREFRRVPNPSNQKIDRYMHVVDSVSRQFFHSNKKVCQDSGYEIEDVKQYALLWTCNYIGLYEVPHETVNDNDRKLFAHLRMRFAEFRSNLYKKGKSIFISFDDATIAAHGRVLDKQETVKIVKDSANLTNLAEDEIDPKYIARHNKIGNLKSVNARKAGADALLTAELSRLPHDKLLEILEEVTQNPVHDRAARREAKRRLKAHREACEICLTCEPPTDSTESAVDNA